MDVLDDQIASIKALGVGIGFGVLEKRQEKLGGLNWMTCAGDTKLFPCRQNVVSLEILQLTTTESCIPINSPIQVLRLSMISISGNHMVCCM